MLSPAACSNPAIIFLATSAACDMLEIGLEIEHFVHDIECSLISYLFFNRLYIPWPDFWFPFQCGAYPILVWMR